MSDFKVTRRPALAALLLSALLLPACGEDTGTLPDVGRSGLVVTVEPNPLAGLQDPLVGSVSASYRITVQETNGLGGELQFVVSTVFDPETGVQVAQTYYDTADLGVFVGQKRLDPLGSAVVPQSVSYILPDFRKAANLVVGTQLKDDRGNVVNQSVLVKIE